MYFNVYIYQESAKAPIKSVHLIIKKKVLVPFQSNCIYEQYILITTSLNK